MNWNVILTAVIADVKAALASQDGLKIEVQVLTSLASKVESYTTNSVFSKIEKFIFTKVIGYLQSKIV